MSKSLAQIILVLLSTLLLPTTYSISFKHHWFEPNTPNIFLQGDALYSNGTVEFNEVNYLSHVGRVTYDKGVHLWDKNSGKISDFSTHFSFVIDTLNLPSGSYGNGLTFFISPVGFGIPFNSASGFLGLFNTTTYDSLDTQMIMVEFDTYANAVWDPPVEHVGINVNSIVSTVYTPWNASVYSGKKADVWINYNATAKNLSVFWSYRNEVNYSKNSSLFLTVDLQEVLPEWVQIGFSAATGKFKERHILYSWEFFSSLELIDKTKFDGKKLKYTTSLIVALCGCVFVLGGVTVFFLMYRKRRQRKTKKAEEASFNNELERGVGPRRFSYLELDSATNNFSSEHKVGQGGFGGVYKGYLIGLDMPIAVKKFSSSESKQGKNEYITEVKIISRLRHRNLVQLIGWCHDKGEFLLVYEFMPNGSLDSHLFGKKLAPLSWPTRYKIALGLASGLLYLHEEWQQCVVHRDIKSSNIMLDSNFDVKLGDFGLAMLMDHGNSSQTLTLAGTYGYMAPEYTATGKASKESDVYSFGVVVLEIATGRRSRTNLMEPEPQKGLVQWVWDLYENDEILSAIDERLCNEFEAKQVECLLLVGLWCAHPDNSLRPSIKQAIQALNFETELPSLPPQMPALKYRVFSPSSSSIGPSLDITSLEIGR